MPAHSIIRQGGIGVAPLLPVADGLVRGEDLLERGGERHCRVKGQRDQRNPDPLHESLAHHDHRANRQRDGGNQLVGDTEQRPQGVDAATRIGHTHQQHRTPRRDDDRCREQRTGDP